MAVIIRGRNLLGGRASGEVLYSSEPLSFWGGLDPVTGKIIDQRHSCRGDCVSGKIFVFPFGRGSSSSSGILLEAVRLGTAPAAIINLELDQILALGAIVGRELYQMNLPVVLVENPIEFEQFNKGGYLTVEEDGSIIFEQKA